MNVEADVVIEILAARIAELEKQNAIYRALLAAEQSRPPEQEPELRAVEANDGE